MTDVRTGAGGTRTGAGRWREAVVYEVYVRSFADGDGVGDLAGARSRLPYLADLGVDAVWLTPFHRSPMSDGGYDVADHRVVDPLFGDLGDLDALLAEASALGLRVLVDVVPNHSSVQHPWFVAARDAALPAGWGEWSVEAQTGGEGSTLVLYRRALDVRRRHLVPAGPGIAEVDAGADVVALRRGPVLCVVDLGGEQVPAPEGARLLVCSDRTPGAPDTAAWWLLP